MALPFNWEQPVPNVINKLILNGVEIPQMYSDYKVINSLTYKQSPTRTSNFTVDNTEIEYAYVPQVIFTFNYMPIRLFQYILEQINQPQFDVEFYDYTLNTTVQRNCYLTQKEINKLYHEAKDITAVKDFSVTFVSRYGYETYDDLKTSTPIDEI